MELKSIDKLYSREDIMGELNRHSEVFNLDDFYLVDPGDFTPNHTGFRIVTSDHVYSGYCFSDSTHEDVVSNVLFGIYGDDFNREYRQHDYEWRDTGVALGAVIMQLVSKYYSMMWLPSDINEFQYNSILEFADQMRKINEKLKDNGMREIIFGACVTKEDGSVILDLKLEEAIEYLSANFASGKKRSI